MDIGAQVRHALGLPCGCSNHQVQIIGDDDYPGAGALAHFPSAPFPERWEGNDAQSWIEPVGQDRTNFMTFFAGNQLPGWQQTPNFAMPLVQSVHIESPSRGQASFGPNIGQTATQDLVTRWRGIWAASGG